MATREPKGSVNADPGVQWMVRQVLLILRVLRDGLRALTHVLPPRRSNTCDKRPSCSALSGRSAFALATICTATCRATGCSLPSALDDLGDRRPYVLWTRGTTSFLARPLSDLVTITGARASTSYGEQVARQLASDLTNAERLVVAGGAYGIEGAAPRAALASGGDTIAVMANGVDRPYPMGHRELLERVADLGVMVSEVPPGAVPTRHRFLARARLMATFSAVTVVVEAGVRSGSMTVARRAHELGRTVGAVPGPVTSVTSVGPHQLISDGVARVVTHADDRAAPPVRPHQAAQRLLAALVHTASPIRPRRL